MDENSEILESGELSDEAFHFKHITWKIPNASSLSNLDYVVQSPTFSFADATWRLKMYPYGETIYETEGNMDILIVRLSSAIPEHHIFYKIYFQTQERMEFESFSDDAIFHSEDHSWGVQFLERSELIKMMNLFAPDGVLMIVCQMRTKRFAGMMNQTQSDSESATLLSCDSTSRPSIAHPDNKLIHDFKELFLKQDECDVVINVQGQVFKAHKTILIARSPVLAATFRHDMKEKAGDPVEIEDCDPSSFSEFLCFLYCGTVDNLSAENAFSLFMTADKYDVQDLRSECLEFIKNNLSVDTFCETVTLALQHSEKELLQLATDFFPKHFKEIIVTVKWQSFVIKNPIQGNEIMVKSFVTNKT